MWYRGVLFLKNVFSAELGDGTVLMVAGRRGIIKW